MKDPNPKKAYGDAKVPMHLCPASAIIAIANGLAEGADKYSPWNWREDDIETLTYVGAVMRHVSAYVEGEDVDPDGNGKTHLEGAIASLAILIDATAVGSLIDNRPKIHATGVLEALKEGSVMEPGAFGFPIGDGKAHRHDRTGEKWKHIDKPKCILKVDTGGAPLMDEDGNLTNLALAVDHRCPHPDEIEEGPGGKYQEKQDQASTYSAEERAKITRGW